jgi:hypothetical protein
LVRSRHLREVEPFGQLGADEVIADEWEVSIEVLSPGLARMLVPRERIQRLPDLATVHIPLRDAHGVVVLAWPVQATASQPHPPPSRSAVR